MNNVVFHLKEPAYLIGLSIVPVFLVFFLGSLAHAKNKIKKFGEKELISRITPENSKVKQVLKFILLVSALGCIAIHLCSPVISFRKSIRNPADIFFVVDVSNSMMAEDVFPNRLGFAKSLILDYPNLWTDARIGLIPFAGQSYIDVPLTRNRSVFKQHLRSLSPHSIPVQGTLISPALELAIKAFAQSEERSKIIVLVTDGENHEPSALILTDSLKKKSIHLLCIGLGSIEGAKIPLHSLNAHAKMFTYLQDKKHNTVISKMNRNVFKELSLNANGFFIPFSKDDPSQIELIRNYLENNRKGYQDIIQYVDFPIFLLMALILLLIEFIIFERKNKFLNKVIPQLRPSFLSLFFLFLFTLFFTKTFAQSKASSFGRYFLRPFDLQKAGSLFQHGNLDEAEKIYKKYLDSDQNSLNNQIEYNLGCLLFQKRDYPEAEAYFNEVIQGQTHNKIENKRILGYSYYNLGNISFNLGRYEESIQFYIKYLRIYPFDPDGLYNLAYARWKMKQNKKPNKPPPEQENEMESKTPGKQPDRSPEEKKPLKSHLEKSGKGNQKVPDLEQNW